MTWWGQYRLEEGAWGFWRAGALSLWVGRTAGEWQVGHSSSNDPQDGTATVAVPWTGEVPLGDSAVTWARFGVKKTDEVLVLEPALPDRPVVSRPETPFHVVADDEAHLFVSSPVWLRLSAGQTPRLLLDIPLYRSSDTWFGPNTREGEYCYASRTSCRRDLEDLPVRPHRAVSPVVIRNRTDKTLVVERLNLPAPNLTLYAQEPGALWTQALILSIDRAGETAEIRMGNNAPPQARNAVTAAAPRQDEGSNILTRALGALIG